MMKALIRFSALPVLAMLMLFTGPAVHAAAPSAPQRLTGQVVLSNNGFDAKLFWYQSIYPGVPAGAPELFEIYQANSNTIDLTLFSKIGEVTKAEIDSLRNTNNSYFYIVHGLAAGEYSFYVTASNADGTSPISDIVHLSTNHAPDWVKFTTTPNSKGDPNAVYVYDADAVSGSNGTVKFKALQIPQGTTLDETTGELRYTYTPNGALTVSFAIQAYLASDPTIHAVQQWYVYFGHDSTNYPRICTVVRGQVEDENGNPVTGGAVNMMMWNSAGYYAPVSSGKITPNGDYMIESHTWGKFTLMINGQLIVTEYYENSADVHNAHEFNTHCGDTVIANFVVQTRNAVWFTSQPPLTADPNQTYSYDANAASNINGVIKFKAINLPQGATLDETTGIVTYTYVPNSSGSVSFEIAAYLESDPSIEARQAWHVRFGNTNHPVHCMIFYGVVEDENGTPVPEGVVTAFWQDSRTGGTVGTPFSGKINAHGQYQIQIYYPGKYILQVNGQTFAMEFYENTTDFHSATVFDAACGDSTEVNFTVDALDYHTITGMVTDRATNQGVLATVLAYGANSNNAGTVGFAAKTDANGNYTLTVPEGANYYVKAMDVHGEYFIQYYDDATSQTAATALSVTGDLTGIDFQLDKKPVRANKIAGTLQDENGDPIIGIIAAYKIDYRQNHPYPTIMYKAMTDSMGYFEFTNLEPGNYVLQVLHCEHGYVPGYYKDGSFAVISWLDATQIPVSENGMITGIVFKLDKTSGIQGSRIFMGNITGKVGGFNSGEVPLESAMVMLIDQTGKVSDWSSSDESGNFIMSKATAGTFNLVADVPGYKLYEEQVTLDYSDNEPIVRGIVLEPLSTTSVDPIDILPSTVSVSVFPNPAVDAVNILFRNTTSGATVNIYNALGMLLRSESISYAAAGTSIALTTANLPAGAYYVRVIAGGAAVSAPLQIVK